MAAEFASAFVTIVPTTRGARQTIERELGDAGDRGGQDAGENFDRSFKDRTKKIGAGLFAAAGAAGGVALLKGAVDAAADFGETVSKSRNIFGQASADVENFAKTAAVSFGISKTAALGAATNFGNIFTQIGFTSDASAKLSTNLIKTAADLGSFNNVDPTDVLDRIAGAMNGEFDSLQQLIPGINAARVEQEALALSGKRVASELTAQEKVTATLAIITKDGAKAQDDFAETSDGLANKQRILSARFDDAKVAIGEKLLPAAVAVTNFFGDKVGPTFAKAGETIKGLSGFVSENRTVIFALAGAYAVSLAPAMITVAALASGALVTGFNAATAAAGRLALAAAPFVAIGVVVGGAALAFQRGKKEAEEFRLGLEALANTDVLDREKFAAAEDRLIALRDGLKDTGIGAFKDEARKAGEALDDLRGNQDRYNDTVAALGRGLNLTTAKVEALARAAGATDLLKQGKYQEAATAIGRVGTQTDKAEAATRKLTSSTAIYAKASEDAEAETRRFGTALDRITGRTLGVQEAADNVEAAYDDLTASFRENGRTLDAGTEKGRANREQLRTTTQAIFDNLTALEGQKVGSRRLSEEFDRGVRKFEATATAAGLTKTEINKLRTELGLTPNSKRILLSQSGAEKVEAAARKAREEIERLRNRQIELTVRVNTIQTQAGVDTKTNNLSEVITAPRRPAPASARTGPTYNVTGNTFVTPDPDRLARELAEKERLGALAGGGR